MECLFKQTADVTFDANEENVDWDGDGTADWDAEDQKGFSPIGNGTKFTGSYDGQGYIITNLYISRDDEDNVGLFGHIGIGAKITNLHLEDANVIGKRGSGSLVAGQHER